MWKLLLAFLFCCYSAFGSELKPGVEVFEKEYHVVGKASFYTDYQGAKTTYPKYGKYDKRAMKAAHFNLPGGSVVAVTNIDKNSKDRGKTIEVTINDRGPFWYKRGRVKTKMHNQKFILDLTPTAFEAVGGSRRAGSVEVYIRILKLGDISAKKFM